MFSSSQKMACNIQNSTIIFYLLFNFLFHYNYCLHPSEGMEGSNFIRELFEDGEFSKTDKVSFSPFFIIGNKSSFKRK